MSQCIISVLHLCALKQSWINAGGQSRRLYRHFTVSSSTQEVLLVDLRLRPASPIFTLLDDHGLAGVTQSCSDGSGHSACGVLIDHSHLSLLCG